MPFTLGFIVIGTSGPQEVGEGCVALQPESDDFTEPPETRKQLEADLLETQAAAYAKGTLRNLVCQWRSFTCFCQKYKIDEWPVSEHTMCLYAQYLAYTFHSVKSVRNYLNGIKTLHSLAGVPTPDLKNVAIRLTLAGLTRKMARPVKQAQPITPEIMIDILTFLNLNKRSDLAFWGILVVGFFGMLHKSNLDPDSLKSFDPHRQLTWGHVEFREQIAVLGVTWAKNIQFKQKVLEIPLFRIPSSPLCPIMVLKPLMKGKGKPEFPLFGKGSKPLFSYTQFQKKFRALLKKAGYQEKAFSSHSIRRGSVLWAHCSGVPNSLIKVHGGWASDAYKRYLTFPIEVRAVVGLKMREAIQKAGL